MLRPGDLIKWGPGIALTIAVDFQVGTMTVVMPKKPAKTREELSGFFDGVMHVTWGHDPGRFVVRLE